MKKFGVRIVALLLMLSLIVAGGATVAFAAGETYYICYESEDYRVLTANRMTASGSAYTASPTMSRGEHFYVTDGKGQMWGNGKGEPLAAVEDGRVKYTVRFDPALEGEKVTVERYAPATFTLCVGGTEGENLTYRHANTVFEEYTACVELNAGDTVTVKGADGTYGETGVGAAGVTVERAGLYRIAFTVVDPDDKHGYGENNENFIEVTEVPKLYLLTKDNGYTQNEAYRMTRDEDCVAYAQYRFPIEVAKNDTELDCRVLDADEPPTKEYLFSSNGKITVRDKGDYYVLFSPTHAYSVDGGTRYYMDVERIRAYYDGYYILGDFNGFTFLEDNDGFDAQYRFRKDAAVTDYDEYTRTFTVTEEMLDAYGGKVAFYITDGGELVRKPNGDNIEIDRAGTYEIKFSPTHNYGRGYRYRYTRTDDEIVSRTVRIDSREKLIEVLAACTSPEYSLGATFELVCDVDLTGVTFTPAKVFAGTFDGLHRTVKFNLSGDNDYTTLFKEVTIDGTVRRVTFDGNVEGDGRYTAPIGNLIGKAEDVTVEGRVKGKDYVGGLAATVSADGRAENCVVRAQVEGQLNVGGIAGTNAGAIADCRFDGTVNGSEKPTSEANATMNVGGIAGYSTGRIDGSTCAGGIGAGQGRNVGGIAGLCSGGLYVVENAANVRGDRYVGGIVGYYGRLQQADAPTDATGVILEFINSYFGQSGPDFTEGEDGGTHEIYYAANRGNVVAENYAGGVAGHAGAGSLTVKGCVSCGDVTANDSYAGGVVGDYSEGTLTECLSYGDVIARRGSYAGGIVGNSAGTVEHCQSSAYVAAGNSYGGGIAGVATAIVGCVSNAAVTFGSGQGFGLIAGEASVSACKNNYFVTGAPLGIDGAEYGAQNNNAAVGLTASALQSAGMLPPAANGLDDEHFLAGESEPRYPVPRIIVEPSAPDGYGDEAAFTKRIAAIAPTLTALADTGSKLTVTVTFFTYDFDSEEYERLTSFRLHIGAGLPAEKIPAVPEKEGYFVGWSIDDFSAFTENTEVREVYARAVTTLSVGDGARPAALVEGKFREGTTLSTFKSGSAIGLRFTYDGAQIDVGDVTVRYYVGGKDVTVDIIDGETVTAAQATRRGDYVSFTLPEGCLFTVYTVEKSLTALWICLSALGGVSVTAAAFVTALMMKRKKKIKKEE